VPLTAGAIGAAFATGVALQLVLVGVTAAIGDLLPFLEPSAAAVARLEEATALRSYARAFAVPFALVFVAPLTEELLFRGAIQPALAERVGRLPAIGITAVLFAVFHLAPHALVYATLAGLLLGALRERTGSILPSFTLHAGFNAAPILLTEALVPIPGFNTGDPEARLPWPVLCAATFAALAALLLFVVQTDPALPLWARRRARPER
jgi:membrane protease YdiL (CAAX protease family)